MYLEGSYLISFGSETKGDELAVYLLDFRLHIHFRFTRRGTMHLSALPPAALLI